MKTPAHRNLKGGAVLSALTACAVFAIILTGTTAFLAKEYRASVSKGEMARVQSLVIDISEYFRSLTKDQILKKPLADFKLCAPVNIFASTYGKKQEGHLDPMVAISENAIRTGGQSKRGYFARVLDLATLVERKDLCTKTIKSVIDLLKVNDRLVFDVEVQYIDQGKTLKRSISRVLAGELIPAPQIDLNLCSSLPSKGSQNYSKDSKCPNGSVVVIIDDGPNDKKIDLMTCCPVSIGVLSSKKVDQNIDPKNNFCGTNEVATGVITPTKVYCTKLSAAFVLGPSVATPLVQMSKVTGDLAQILSKYPDKDACTCPEGTVMIASGPLAKDNVCSGKCATIIKKALP